MYDKLETYISSLVDINEKEMEAVKSAFVPKNLRKRQYLLQEGQVSKHFAFVVKGALRQYIVDEMGHEHITQFAIENWWISDRESLVNETPSKYNIDALEDSELLLISKADVLNLEDSVPAIHKLLTELKERRSFAGQNRLLEELTSTAEEKYEHFIETYPTIAQRVPQHMIASYLGVTPETISRLRAKRVKE